MGRVQMPCVVDLAHVMDELMYQCSSEIRQVPSGSLLKVVVMHQLPNVTDHRIFCDGVVDQ